ncbi:hypothetical protein [Acrocarpospora phusangensis]|uniref:hypothetical protein n=1 Tax=Acrocarpospora phusangensis TaxID=1070424 RepID=UPI00194FA046|nr:hypothetical protein [Acrocarpospora phusangensis]
MRIPETIHMEIRRKLTALALAGAMVLAAIPAGPAHASAQTAYAGSVSLSITPSSPYVYLVQISGTAPSAQTSTYMYGLYGNDFPKADHLLRIGMLGPATTEPNGTFTQYFLVTGDILDEDSGVFLDEIYALVRYDTPLPVRSARSNTVVGSY